MMIKLTQGDLLKKDDVEAIVNAVNCAGVMGKGIALLFKGGCGRRAEALQPFRRPFASISWRPGLRPCAVNSVPLWGLGHGQRRAFAARPQQLIKHRRKPRQMLRR